MWIRTANGRLLNVANVRTITVSRDKNGRISVVADGTLLAEKATEAEANALIDTLATGMSAIDVR